MHQRGLAWSSGDGVVMASTSNEQRVGKQDNSHSNMIVLTERRMASDRFNPIYKRGMALVEETAHYLDSDGRDEAKGLSKPVAMLYASESMRLTTRLMQLASWLLLQRAVNSGEMTINQVMQERTKVRLETPSDAAGNPAFAELPKHFRMLIEHSLMMERDIRRIDHELYGDGQPDGDAALSANPVNEQLALLRTAFARG
jgi:regulator of CtrA degradation